MYLCVTHEVYVRYLSSKKLFIRQDIKSNCKIDSASLGFKDMMANLQN